MKDLPSYSSFVFHHNHPNLGELMNRFGVAFCWLAITSCVVPRGFAQETGQQSYKAYQNYDFVPGDKVLFEDDFRSDKDGEFASYWKLESGQGAVNQFQGEPALVMTEGNYFKVSPRIVPAKYLSDSFTVELDYYALPVRPANRQKSLLTVFTST